MTERPEAGGSKPHSSYERQDLMTSKMNNELTMEQMASASGGHLNRAAVDVAKDVVTFYVRLVSNFSDGEDFAKAAHNVGEDIGIVKLENREGAS